MRNKMKYILSLLLVVVGLNSYGQQDPHYTQYMYNMHILNPAYAGSEGTLNLRFLGRSQWVGIKGAPKTLTASINAPIGKRVGLGFSVIADKIGPVSEQNIYADFSYTLPVNEEANLAFGLKGGMSILNANLSTLRLPDGSSYTEDDNLNKLSPNFGAGLFYYTSSFYVGFSVPNILRTKYIDKDYSLVEEMHGYLTGGFVFDVSESVKLKPSTLLKATAGSPLSLDLSLNALINDFLELGVSWRKDDSVSGMLGIQVSRSMRLGYAYDYTLSGLGDYSSGSHEIMLLMNISSKRATLSPRFF